MDNNNPVPSVGGNVRDIDQVALDAATAILPMYFENIPGYQLKAKIQEAVHEAILAAQPQAAAAAPSEREMAIAQAVRQACNDCYSPDDLAADWIEKMGDLDLSDIIRSVSKPAQSDTGIPGAVQPTDISQRLREYAGNPSYSHNDYADTMRMAADECERYYGGMMNWKANAQAKDRTIADLRAQLQAAPVAMRDAVEAMERVKKLSVWDSIDHSLHRELDVIFRALAAPAAAQAAPSLQAAGDDLDRVYAAFGIGEQARTIGVLLENISNTIRRAKCLGAIEREFFMVPGEPDEDCPLDRPYEECLLKWGATPEQYVEQFRAALAAKAEAPSDSGVLAKLQASIKGMQGDLGMFGPCEKAAHIALDCVLDEINDLAADPKGQKAEAQAPAGDELAKWAALDSPVKSEWEEGYEDARKHARKLLGEQREIIVKDVVRALELAFNWSDARAPIKEVIAVVRNTISQQAEAKPVPQPQVRSLGGSVMPLASLLESLHQYSKIMPIAGRAQWAMREAAKYIEAIADPVTAERSEDARDAAVLEFVQAIAHNYTVYDEVDDETYCRGCSALVVEEDGRQATTHQPDCIVPRAVAWLAAAMSAAPATNQGEKQ